MLDRRTARLNTVPDTVCETKCFPLVGHRGLDFGIVLQPGGAADAYPCRGSTVMRFFSQLVRPNDGKTSLWRHASRRTIPKAGQALLVEALEPRQLLSLTLTAAGQAADFGLSNVHATGFPELLASDRWVWSSLPVVVCWLAMRQATCVSSPATPTGRTRPRYAGLRC